MKNLIPAVLTLSFVLSAAPLAAAPDLPQAYAELREAVQTDPPVESLEEATKKLVNQLERAKYSERRYERFSSALAKEAASRTGGALDWEGILVLRRSLDLGCPDLSTTAVRGVNWSAAKAYFSPIPGILDWLSANQASVAAYAKLAPKADELVRPTTTTAAAVDRLKADGIAIAGLALPFDMPNGTVAYLMTASQAAKVFDLAYAWKTLETLPQTVSGFDTKSVLAFIAANIGAEASSALRCGVAYGRNKAAYWNDAPVYDRLDLYKVPLIEAWTELHKEELARVFEQGWDATVMPTEKASVWAAQELAVQKGLKPDQLVVATPLALYVDPKYYVEFMTMFRSNKQALVGEDIAAALAEFSKALAGELKKIEAELARIDADIRAGNAKLAGISQQQARLRKAVAWNGFTNIMLHVLK